MSEELLDALRKRGLKMPVLPSSRDDDTRRARLRGSPRPNTDDPASDRVIDVIVDE